MAAPKPDSIDAIAARLRLIRRAFLALQGFKKDDNLSEFARQCDIGIAAWHNLERGDNRIGIDNAMRVARRTGASLDYIYFGQAAGLPHALATKIQQLDNPRAGKRPMAS